MAGDQDQASRDVKADQSAPVGFIGLGDMGQAIALNLLRRGWTLHKRGRSRQARMLSIERSRRECGGRR